MGPRARRQTVRRGGTPPSAGQTVCGQGEIKWNNEAMDGRPRAKRVGKADRKEVRWSQHNQDTFIAPDK